MKSLDLKKYLKRQAEIKKQTKLGQELANKLNKPYIVLEFDAVCVLLSCDFWEQLNRPGKTIEIIQPGD